MFDALTTRLTGIFGKISGKGRLTAEDLDAALKEVRVALLEADVNFRVARDLVARVREQAIGTEILVGLDPGSQVVSIINQEMTATLTAGDHRLNNSPQPPTVIMLVGLQGAGKTTTAAKLALHLQNTSRQGCLLVATDLRRPAAIEQLVTLGQQLGIPVYHEQGSSDPTQVASRALVRAQELGSHWVILDTGGRLHIDNELMQELQAMKKTTSPREVILVVDAMMGQDAVQAAAGFHEQIGITGLIMAKLDGDARGGAALSIAAATGVPIKFVGVGEQPNALEPFYPDRIASRILGMGDILSLAEKAKSALDETHAHEMERKLLRATFDLEDFLDQIQAVKKMGPLSQVLELIPGFSQIKDRLAPEELEGAHFKKTEAMVHSMTPVERRRPEIIGGSRKRRIARGSGTSVQEINQLLNQFRQMQRMMKQMARGKNHGARNPFELPK
jgi:signal recognition particle subunit SRP54